MISIRRSLLLIIMAILIGGSGYCQDQAREQNLMMVDGTVLSVDTSNSLIVVNAEIDYTFSVNLSTKFTRDIYDIHFSDIEAGDYVDVSYYDEPSGKHIATHISIDYGPDQS